MLRRAGPGAAGREGAASPASAPAPAPWRRTTATVSTARQGRHSLLCFLASRAGRPAAPLAARVSREQRCGTRARGAGPGGSLRRAGVAGRLRGAPVSGAGAGGRRAGVAGVVASGSPGQGPGVSGPGVSGPGSRAAVTRRRPGGAPRTFRFLRASGCVLGSFRPFLLFASCVPRSTSLSETKMRKQQVAPKRTGFTRGVSAAKLPGTRVLSGASGRPVGPG